MKDLPISGLKNRAAKNSHMTKFKTDQQIDIPPDTTGSYNGSTEEEGPAAETA